MAKKIDGITVEIVGNLLLSIAEEMGHVIIKSAYSTNIKERRDLSTAVFDPEGNMVAQAEHVPMHLGSLLGIVKEVYKVYKPEEVNPGDMFISNDPYGGGGTHLPDITVVAPVFEDKKIIAWIANLAHHSDIGGKVPGSTSGDANSIFQEGTRIPIVKVCSNGVLNMDIIKIIMCNSRMLNERYGDLQAQIAANTVGVKRVHEAYVRYSDKLVESMYQLQEYAYTKLKAGIRKLPDGVYKFKDYMDDAGAALNEPIPICVEITIEGDDLTIDFEGTNKQVAGPINVTLNGLLATVFYALKSLIDPKAPSNAGIYRAFEVKCKEGLIVNAKSPAPVGVRIDTCQRVVDVIYGALSDIIPERAIGCCNSSVTSAIFSGYDPIDEDIFHVYLETIAGGSGASQEKDGLSGVQVHMTNTSNLPVEALEMEFPLICVNKYELRKDSGGAGKNRGGLGITREFEINYDNIKFTGLGDRHIFAPWGICGGKEGACGKYEHITDGLAKKLASKCTDLPMKKGDIVRIETPGSGGYGNPIDREPGRVLFDVIEGKVSPESAEKDYKVCLKSIDGSWWIDQEKTQVLRKSR